MTNEEFWTKPKDAVYVGLPISKVGIALLVIVSYMAYAKIKSVKKITRHSIVSERQVFQNQERSYFGN